MTEIIRDFELSPLHSQFGSFVDRNDDDFPSAGGWQQIRFGAPYGIRNSESRAFVYGRGAVEILELLLSLFQRRPAKNEAAERKVLHNRHKYLDRRILSIRREGNMISLVAHPRGQSHENLSSARPEIRLVRYPALHPWSSFLAVKYLMDEIIVAAIEPIQQNVAAGVLCYLVDKSHCSSPSQ